MKKLSFFLFVSNLFASHNLEKISLQYLMPLEMIKDGKQVGISADYFKLFRKKIDIPIHLIVTKSWLQSLEYAKSRKYDIFSFAISISDREKYMDFTKP